MPRFPSPHLLVRAGKVAALAWLAAAAALCAAQEPPTSSVAVPDGRALIAPAPGDPQRPGPMLDVPVPPGPGVVSGQPRPAPAVPGAVSPPGAPPAVPLPAPAPVHGNLDIALVLPLQAPAYARAADAVRTGFMAAAQAAGVTDRCVVVGHGRDGVIGAFDNARAKGVLVIVGPLVRDDLKTLAIAGGAWPTTIALNQLDDGTPLPPNFYSLALAVESDARVLARRALADGARSVMVVEGESPLMHRLATAFTTARVADGGAVPDDFAIDTSFGSLADLRRALARHTPDAVLLAVDGDRAALVKSFVGAIPAYASGLVFERPAAATARDLDGIRIVDLPWILTPDAPALAQLPRRDFNSDALTRLYALGLDAFRVAEAFVHGTGQALEFDGAIGHLALDAQRVFQREGTLGIYRDGQLVPLEAAR
jgi:outer membrane PBP1 activator LpoA protein